MSTELILSKSELQRKIHFIRGLHVMLDRVLEGTNDDDANYQAYYLEPDKQVLNGNILISIGRITNSKSQIITKFLCN